ncbi:ABC-2 type transport system ATP-binding protein [Curtobacterium sp. 314Chir4.1]|jgi:ABC-2 type transport system ATP-binding protein|uniref:ABC transporter ATP-binding protein n=1 Tax=Curtobacterium sp. 314Chir4.1 TaxID=1279028 RepID=UPI000BCF099A|nr:ATP-binding cassette domain-containing protein [Curtobacterium sp. 314Chir4.1]SOC88044.1 ABC-2 type transport system ATP-binding protein [Curtobacterium sp. 314Chir4.1]
MLTIDGVTKQYGDRRVLDDVTFTVGDGRLTGFVGGNGAGKTTTMRILLGVLQADAGTVSIDGTTIGPADRRRFGYMPEERGLYPKMPVAEQITYFARLHGVDKRTAASRTTDLLDRLGLAPHADDAVEKLSLGNQQRVQVAAALAHDPEVLVLDEPFSGLDPMAVDVVLAVLREAAAGGVPVLFSSHQLDVVERLCDDVVVIAGGTIRAAGPQDELRKQAGPPAWELLVEGDVAWLRDEPGVTVREFDGGYAVFEADDTTAQRVLQRAVQHGTVGSFSPRVPRLSEVFREVVR